jgi:iron-sulfur cluster assembly protein
MMFTLTSTAAQQIQQAAADAGAQDAVLRVAARRVPDGSIDYGMGFDDMNDGDTALEIENVHVVIAPQHLDLLEDTVLDFVELEPGQFHFIFSNQQSAFEITSAGGCGSGGCGSCGSSKGGSGCQ